MRGGQDQRHVLLGDLIGAPQENSAWLIDSGIDRSALDHLLQPFLQRLFVASGLVIEDQQVGLQPVKAPICVGLEKLADQADIARSVDADHSDGQVARDAMGPKARLAVPVLSKPFAWGAKLGVRVEHAPGQKLETAGVVRLDAQVAQLDLRVGPGKGPGAVEHVRVAVLPDPRQNIFSCLARPEYQRKLNASAGLQPHLAT